MNNVQMDTFMHDCSLAIDCGRGQPGVLASPLKDLQKEKKLIEQKLNNINTNINKKKSEITVNKSNIERIMDQDPNTER